MLARLWTFFFAASGALLRVGGSDAVVTVTAEGAGRALRLHEAHGGVGRHRVATPTYPIVRVDRVRSGGSEAIVAIAAAGAGWRLSVGGHDAVVTITGTAAGYRRSASGRLARLHVGASGSGIAEDPVLLLLAYYGRPSHVAVLSDKG